MWSLVAEVTERCCQRTLKRTPRFIRVIDERSAFGWCLAGCISRSTLGEPIIGAIPPRQWRQHLAVGETHGHENSYSPKARQRQKQPLKHLLSPLSGLLKPV